VLAYPAGINREELVRLAKLQVPVEHFSKSKLSKGGYLVRIEDQDVKLPCMSSCDQSCVVDDTFAFHSQ
jgi:glutamate dehydrogenase